MFLRLHSFFSPLKSPTKFRGKGKSPFTKTPSSYPPTHQRKGRNTTKPCNPPPLRICISHQHHPPTHQHQKEEEEINQSIDQAMSSPPPPLPISSPHSTTTVAAATTTTTTGQSQAPITTPAFRAFVTHISDLARNAFSQRRPWSELVDRSAFARPDSVTEAASRARKNFSYFRINYFTLLASVLAFSLVTHPVSLLVLLCLLASWIFLYLFRPSDPPLVLFGRTFNDRETLGMLSLLSVVVVFLTSVGSILISGLMVGLAIVFAHGACRVPEDLFLDEQEPAAVGFLSSFLGGGGFSAAPAPAGGPPVAGRV